MEKLKKHLGLHVVEVSKPAHHYAYVEFTEDILINETFLNTVRNGLTRYDIDVFPVYTKLPKALVNVRSYETKSIEDVRLSRGALVTEKANDADGQFGVHNGHKCKYETV